MIVKFAVNDDLSIGFNDYESEQSGTTSVTADAQSFQIAYTMGGASLRLAESKANNMTYSTDSVNDKDATTISVSLAF